MTDLLLSWPHPAVDWTEAMPVGNGRLGAMVFGGAGRTRIQVNDATVWSGTPDGPASALKDIDAGPERLAEVREAVFAKDFRRAEELLMTFEGPYSQEFLPYVDLWLTLPEGTSHGRTLNLDNGVATEKLTINGQDVERTTWVSRPAQVLCVALSGTIDVGVDVSTPLREVSRDGLDLGIKIPVDGAPRHEPQVAEPLRYGTVEGYDPFAAVAVRVARTATGVLIVLASSTSAYDAWIGDRQHTRDEHRRRAAVLAEQAVNTGAAELRRAHEADLRPLLARRHCGSGSTGAAPTTSPSCCPERTNSSRRPCSSSTAGTSWPARPGPARRRRTCRASGTTTSARPGRPTTPSTSTPR